MLKNVHIITFLVKEVVVKSFIEKNTSQSEDWNATVKWYNNNSSNNLYFLMVNQKNY